MVKKWLRATDMSSFGGFLLSIPNFPISSNYYYPFMDWILAVALAAFKMVMSYISYRTIATNLPILRPCLHPSNSKKKGVLLYRSCCFSPRAERYNFPDGLGSLCQSDVPSRVVRGQLENDRSYLSFILQPIDIDHPGQCTGDSAPSHSAFPSSSPLDRHLKKCANQKTASTTEADRSDAGLLCGKAATTAETAN